MSDPEAILSIFDLSRPGGAELPPSEKRFPDGGQYRVEIPSVEGPGPLEAVIAESRRRDVPVHRISQGSGIALQTDAEIERMVELGASHAVEVCLFHSRAAWDTGVQAVSSAGRVVAGSLRGAEQLRYAVEDVAHACELGIRSVLVSDLGLLATLGALRSRGDLPQELILKVSAALPVANPATARTLEDLGANTLNLVVDLPLSAIAAIRAAVDIPVDVYVESPDDFGGAVRHHEIAQLVRVAAPVYLKFGIRNSPPVYPSGAHLEDLVVQLAVERVRRAEIGLGFLNRSLPSAVCSPVASLEAAPGPRSR
jgi:hypothetical protein